ncbi:hypothetical protein N7492_007678 [Penicillium capsulatum]|uniref:Uncharacterized protein n=1 Tax=Penicillium capsulatum TaxID=69766 RepID=A0A9W9LMA4_9EURO|nr:hypothetical protein N7492_007678 [Penicillium capsulatum]
MSIATASQEPVLFSGESNHYPVQDIIRDTKSPNIWNVPAARVIHVHILDPVSCEEVTHVVPPPVPPSAYEAAASKLPFFVMEEQVDNRVDGGDFEQVHSVSQMDQIKGISSEPTFDPSQPTMCRSCEKRLCDCM